MMINWRDGKAGFVGASKRLIKGFFEYQYSVTSDAVIVVPDPTPSGKGRVLGFQGKNRTIGFTGKNRTLS